MKRSIATILIPLSVLVSWLVWPARVRAEPLREALIDARARWVVHLDMRAARACVTGKLLLNNPAVVGDFIQPMREDLGIDPATDLASLTIYAPEPDAQQSVTLLVTEDDTAQRIIESLRNAHPETFEMQSEEAGLVCKWKVENKRWRLAVRADPAAPTIGPVDAARAGDAPATIAQRPQRVVILAQRSRSLHEAIEVIEGKRASLARAAADNDARTPGVLLAVHPLEPEERPAIRWPLSELVPAVGDAEGHKAAAPAGAGAALVRVMGCVGDNPGPWSKIGSGVEGFDLAVREERDESGEALCAVTCRVRAVDAEHAERIEVALRSLVPLLNPAIRGEAGDLKAHADAVRTERQEREVRIDLRMPQEDLRSVLNRHVPPEAKAEK